MQPSSIPTVSVASTPTFISSATKQPTALTSNTNSPTLSFRPTVVGTKDYLIRLQSRQFVPEAEIQSGLKWLSGISSERVHVLLQLFNLPDSAEKTQLEKSGIELLNYIPSNTWFASIPNNLQIHDPSFVLVRWFGSISPEFKLSTSLSTGSIGSWAIRGENKIVVDVSFFEDVDSTIEQDTIIKYGAEIIKSTSISNKLTIVIPKDNVFPLAMEDIVRWIDQIPPPPITQ